MRAHIGRRGSLQWLFVLPAAIFLADSVYCSSATECVQQICSNDSSKVTITCIKSLILIVDVIGRDWVRNRSAFESLKRKCTSKQTCDLSSICASKFFFVKYFCVDDKHIHRSSCDGSTSQIGGKFGYIQSPGYPNTTAQYIPCKWQIDLANDSYVTLSAHDMATSGTKKSCDGGLIVSGSDCEGKGKFAPRLLCAGDELRSIVRCGKVDVELSASKDLYPLRFWLSYHVQSKKQIVSTVQSCWFYTEDSKMADRGNSPSDTDQADTQIFIVLLCVFCGISVVLMIILIIVCIRCRQMRLSLSDHVYSEPSPGLQAHYDYISSLEDEKPRPKLNDEYFEVADALPADQRRNLPSSPAYAEVEQFAQLKKGQWSSMGSSDWPDPQRDSTVTDNVERTQGSDGTWSPKSARTYKGGIMTRIVPERFSRNSKSKSSQDIESPSSSGPKVYVVNIKNRPFAGKHAGNISQSDDVNMQDDPSPYEQIEVIANNDTTDQCSSIDQAATGTNPVVSKHNKSKHVVRNDKVTKGQLTRTQNVVRETSGMPSRVNQIKEGLLSKNNNSSSGSQGEREPSCDTTVLGGQEKKFSYLNNKQRIEVPSSTNRSSKPIGKSSVGKPLIKQKKDADKQSPVRTQLLRDGPKTEGIVKNGIQKFEHNTAL